MQYVRHLIIQFGGDCLPYLESNNVLCSVINVLFFYGNENEEEMIRTSLFVLNAFMEDGNKEYAEFLQKNHPTSYKRMILSLLKIKESFSTCSFEFRIANEIFTLLEGDEEYVEEEPATNSQEREILMQGL